MRRLLLLTTILIPLVAAPQSSSTAELVRIGALAGENGEFGSVRRLVTMYSGETVRTQLGKDTKWQTIAENGPFSLEVRRDGLHRTGDKVPRAVAHDFQFCDPLNQVDLSETASSELRSALPKKSKIKALESLGAGITLVVFADGDAAIRYPLHLALFQSHGETKVNLRREDTVSADGNYCGMQSLAEGFRAVLVDEPSANSDFSTVYFYYLKP